MEHKERFEKLANFILENEDLFVRKTSDEDQEAYDNGDDEYGDIVFWADRQMNVDVQDIVDQGEENEEDWYECEAELLADLIKENLKEGINSQTLEIGGLL